jgi:hypothetical protein
MSHRFILLARSLLAGLLVAQALALTVALADEKPDLKPLLGERGDVIFAEDFNGPDAKPFPVAAAAEPTVIDGHLSLKQVKDAKHIGVVNLWTKDRPTVTDMIMQADFQWDGGYGFNVEFKKPGPVKHGEPPEFFVVFKKSADPKRPMSWSVADNAPKAVLGKESTPIEPGAWSRFLIEIRDGEVAVQLDNGQTIRGKCNLASSPKASPSLSFGGVDSKGVNVDNVRVWNFK